MTKFGKVCLILGLMAVGAGIFINSASVAAQPGGAGDSSWVTSGPKVQSFIPDQVKPSCAGVQLKADIDGVGKQLPVCVVDEEPVSGLRWGYYLSYGLPQSVVSFNHDPKFYMVTGVPYVSRAVRYIASSDTLILGSPTASGRLTIFEKVTQRLKRRLNLTQTYFDFDGATADYMSFLPGVGAIGVSNNGRYVAFEIRESGIGLLDRQTMTIKRISSRAIHYGWGSDPASEFAVSDDGKLVAQVGLNAPFNVFAVNDECGVIMNVNESTVLQAPECPVVSLPYGDFMTDSSAFFAPSFNNAGTLLKVYMATSDGHSGYVTLAPSGYVADRLDYLALGDSYTSGEGETNNDFYRLDTDTESEKCHLSLRSYPFLYGLSLGLPTGSTQSVACSGASSGDITGNDDGYWGQGKRLGSGGMNLSDADRISYQKQALDQFIPGRVHQISFVEKYTPRLVTVGIGGNDSGLFGKLAACAMPNSCEWVSDKGKAQTYKEINALEPKLTATYQKIKQASPGSQVYVVNYPSVINPAGDCDSVTAAMFNPGERRLIAESVLRINDVIDRAASEAGLKVLNIETSFNKHRLCDNASQSAVSSLRIGNDFGPGNSKLLHLLGNETFHPTPYGQQLVAATLYAQLSQLDQTPAGCGNSCQEKSIDDYWPTDAQAAVYPRSNSVDLTTTKQIQTLDMSFAVQLPTNSLMPSPSAVIRVDDSTALDTLSRPDGSLAADLALPDNLSEGIHTVHIEGESPSGEPIDNYEMVSYNLPGQIGPSEDDSQTDDAQTSTGESGVDNVKPMDGGEQAAEHPVQVNPPVWRPGYNPFGGILPWGWRLLWQPTSMEGYPPGRNSNEQRAKNQKPSSSAAGKSKSPPAVLGWRTQTPPSWSSWLFGPVVLYSRFQLTQPGQPGIMNPWLIFALW